MTPLMIKVKSASRYQRVTHLDGGARVIHLRVPSIDGKANQAPVVRLVKQLGGTKSQDCISPGQNTRTQCIYIKTDL